MMEINKILWPTDFSENSNAALAYVLSLTTKYGAEIYLLYVAEDLTDYREWYGELGSDHAQKIRDWEIPKAEKAMESICRTELQGCPMFHKLVVVGDPAQKILETAKKEGIDVIVMATHGRSGQFEIGSVTDKIVKNSPVPVWTVRPIQRER
ncbi:MAG: universal stress protein [Thermodesulfobacteriota bacterium]|nr:universal stress protein [Thermodesulfobacteriota bacterium]